MPTVMLMLLAVTAIVGVAVTSAVQAQRGASRDADTKAGLLVAEAGVSQALLHYNRVPTTPAQPCVVTNGAQVTNAATVGGWCPTSSGVLLGESFSYTVRPTEGAIEIVSTGNSDGVTRRVDVNASSSSGQRMFTDATVKAQDWINLNSNAEVLTGVATNGQITMSSDARICGSASVGVGRAMSAMTNARWYADYSYPNCVSQLNPANVPQAPLTLPTVNQGDAATNNDNGRFFSQDLISGSPAAVCFNRVRGNGTAGSCGSRVLDLSSNTSLTLSGDTYSLCRLEMSSNTTLFINAGATVRIYFDSPEACGLAPGTAQLALSSNSRITSTAGNATNVGMYFVGSDTQASAITLASNTQVVGDCEQNFVIYAPRTAITMDSNSTYCGALAGKTIQINSQARIYADSGASSFVLPAAAPHYVVDRFVECGSNPGATPNAGC
ncbi:MAG: DUF7305 domain-containing protein [Solirubrobacterales bacterium]